MLTTVLMNKNTAMSWDVQQAAGGSRLMRAKELVMRQTQRQGAQSGRILREVCEQVKQERNGGLETPHQEVGDD